MAPQLLRKGRPISTRKTDCFYLLFLFISCLLALFLDFVPLWPIAVPEWYKAPRAAFIKTYNDPLYVLDPPFFQLFMWVELFALVPGAIVVGWALIKDHKLAPLYLLVWATYYVTSTAVCYVELVATKDWPTDHIAGLKPSYLIFGLVGVGIMLDSFNRVKNVLLGKEKSA